MRRTALALLLLIALAAAGCGSSDSSGDAGASADQAASQTTARSDGAGVGRLQVEADPSGQLKYTQASLTAKPGLVRIAFANTSGVPHDVVIAQGDTQVAKSKTITKSTDEVAVDLQPGTYTYYCSVVGHRQAGMEGTLTVQ
jgi:plastocyanin